MKPGGALQAKVIQDLKSSSKGHTKSTVLIFPFFCLKFNVFWVFLSGKSYYIVLWRFVQELPKGRDCKVKKTVKTQRRQNETERGLTIVRLFLALARMADKPNWIQTLE